MRYLRSGQFKQCEEDLLMIATHLEVGDFALAEAVKLVSSGSHSGLQLHPCHDLLTCRGGGKQKQRKR
jgi:hypothetical protein